jgi:serine/threonine protein kinase
MATVHFGRLQGAHGFARTVAIKRLLPHIHENRDLARRFFDEARLAARIRHANVVQTLDVELFGEEGLVVMEFVLGETLGRLLQVACRSDEPPPPAIVSAIVGGALHGLHAAHQAKSDLGVPLGIVHRDVSPQNILVGVDGVARILDFGIAKATAQTSVTPGGQLKGKAAYMAPELLRGQTVTFKADLFAAAIVLWESLVGRRLFLGETEAETLANVLSMPVEPPSSFVPRLPPGLDRVVLAGLQRDPAMRFDSARDMAVALEQAAPPASTAEVAGWVDSLAHETIASRATVLSKLEASPVAVEPAVLPNRPSIAAPAADAERLRPSSSPISTRRIAWPLVLGAGVVGTVLAASFTLLLNRPAPEEQPTETAFTGEAVPSSSDPVAVGEPPAAASAEAPTPVATPPRRVLRTRAETPKAAPSSPCSPPFTYNAKGHKVFKPQCL